MKLDEYLAPEPMFNYLRSNAMPAPPTTTTPVPDRNWAGQVFLALFPGAVGCLLAGLILDPRAAAGRFLVAYATVALASWP